MGNKNIKIQKNEDFKKIGQEANKNSPSQFYLSTNINLTNELKIGKSKNNPKEKYVTLQIIGEGNYARVYKVKNKYTNIEYAMKVIKKSSACSTEEENHILNEIEVLKKLDHPSILKIFELYSDDTNFSIITELCPRGELFNEIIEKGPFNEKYTSYVMYQILSGVNYFHRMHIIHRDLKPENILIVEKNKDNKDNLPIIKITDFGTSEVVEKDSKENKSIGNVFYMAPEILKHNYNEKCDIWSCGVIMYFLLSGKPPFSGRDEEEIYKKILDGKYDLKSPPFDKLSKNCLNLLENLLKIDFQQRYSAEEALHHPWFQEFKSKEIYNKITDRDAIKTLFKNLKNYKRTSILQEIALAYLVHQFPRTKDVVNACKLFNKIDKNEDGKINKEELYDSLVGIIKIETLKKDIDLIFQNLDMDNNGYIEYEEFVRASVSKEFFLSEKVLKFAFRYFDKDNSGEIELKEIKELLFQNIDDKNNDMDEILNKIIKEVDKNKDGKINFEEFSDVMKKMIR